VAKKKETRAVLFWGSRGPGFETKRHSEQRETPISRLSERECTTSLQPLAAAGGRSRASSATWGQAPLPQMVL